MKKVTTSPFLVIAVLLIFVGSSSFTNNEVKQKTVNLIICDSCGGNPETTLKTNMRKLWEDHITWTRNVILCLVDELPGADQAVKRLMQNQTDIGNAVKPYYGEEAGKKLTELLKDHINISADVVKSAKAANTPALDAANKKWFANANEIAEFLCKANPKWALKDMKLMMDDHLKLTTLEALQRIKKDYDADILAYDKVHDEILKMADMLTEGIVKQFPGKFKKSKSAVAKN